MQVQVIDYQAHDAAERFTRALKEIGFAVLSNHPVDQQLIDKNYKAWGDFFNSEEKIAFQFDSKTHDGLIPLSLSETAKGNDIKDLKEFYHFYLEGRCPEHLRAVTSELFQSLTKLASILLGWIEDNLPDTIRAKLANPLRDMIKDSPLTLFRLLHYPPLTGTEQSGAVRAAEHEDINLITVLPAATAKGLQVKDSDGNWLEVPCNPNWMIINVGDMLQECTDFYYPSTTHRVINPADEAAKEPRLSMPLFLHPHDDATLSDRYTAGSYRKERYAELGLL